jgi:hypothetical protein
MNALGLGPTFRDNPAFGHQYLGVPRRKVDRVAHLMVGHIDAIHRIRESSDEDDFHLPEL